VGFHFRDHEIIPFCPTLALSRWRGDRNAGLMEWFSFLRVKFGRGMMNRFGNDNRIKAFGLAGFHFRDHEIIPFCPTLALSRWRGDRNAGLMEWFSFLRVKFGRGMINKFEKKGKAGIKKENIISGGRQ
jgi:hypothetical protein